MSSVGIKVVGGLHDGAVVGFSEGAATRLGSGASVDVLIVDPEVAELQCTFLWSGGDDLLCEAGASGMAVQGTAILAGKPLALPVGAVLTMPTLSLHVVRITATEASDGSLQAAPTTDAEQDLARRRVLRQLGWLPYLREVLWQHRTAGWVVGSTVIACFVAVLLLQIAGSAPTPKQLRAEAAQRLRTLFPAVSVTPAAGDGSIRYQGYVRDQRELDQLRTIALGVDPARTVVQVVPMDVLQANAAMWLEEFYDEAEVTSVGPGQLQVTVGSEAAIRSLPGWDFERIGQQLKHELPELVSVRVVLAQRSGKEIDIPAARMGMSFLPGSGNSVYVIDAKGAALFAGAQTSEGWIESITPCGLRLRSQTSGSIYRVSSGNVDCGNKDVAPATAGENLSSLRGDRPR